MTAVFLRELSSYFISPVGYVYLAAFYLLAGYQFTVTLLGGSADLTSEFTFLYTVVLLLTPILTMRPMDMTLEDIFLQLTNEDKGAN